MSFGISLSQSLPLAVSIVSPETVDLVSLQRGPQGDPGPPGPAGPSGAAGGSSFAFAASAVWTIVHNLGRRPSITCADSANDTIYGDVDYPDLNTIIVTFSAPTSGDAYVI